MTVTATVPVGGVTCGGGGGGIQVDASTPIVLPGGSFEYAVTVPNSGDCTLKNVKVVLTVTGPDGTTITGAVPDAAISGLTATWANIGSIAPGALKTVKATIKVPTNAPVGATFKGTATATGTCNGASETHTADSGPVPTVGSGSNGCDLGNSGISSSHKEVRIGDYFNEYVRLNNVGKAHVLGHHRHAAVPAAHGLRVLHRRLRAQRRYARQSPGRSRRLPRVPARTSSPRSR